MSDYENDYNDTSDFDAQHVDNNNEYSTKKKYTYDERFRSTKEYDYNLLLSNL